MRGTVFPTPFLNNRERCLADRNSGDDQILAIVLRNPVKHVLSQFLHCKYAHPANWRDPAFPSAPGVYDGFEEWITHFLQLKDRQQTMATSTSTTKQAKQAFSCYNPWNMQTRYLTSKEEDRARGCPNVLCPCHVASVLELKKTSILESMLSSILWTLWVSQISMLRAYAFSAFQQPWLCAPVLCLWWGRAFDEHHQHRTWGSSPWYRWFASGFVEEGIFVGSARCATFRLCSGALRAGTTQCIQEHRSSNGMWGSVEEAMGSDCVHPVDMFCSRPEKGVVNFTVPKISPSQKFCSKDRYKEPPPTRWLISFGEWMCVLFIVKTHLHKKWKSIGNRWSLKNMMKYEVIEKWKCIAWRNLLVVKKVEQWP